MKRKLTFVILLAAVPALVLVGALLFDNKYYAFVSVTVALLACVPPLYAFEKRNTGATELVMLAVLIALTAASRFIFAWTSGLKPVTALVILVGMTLGSESGFVVGALGALLSNFYFGNGPWTPFQMFAWGVIGFVAGILATPLKKNKILLFVYGALSGVAFSLIMDVYTALWMDNTLKLSRYFAIILTSLPTTVSYAVSNVVFLVFLSVPVGKTLERIKVKYGVFKHVN